MPRACIPDWWQWCLSSLSVNLVTFCNIADLCKISRIKLGSNFWSPETIWVSEAHFTVWKRGWLHCPAETDRNDIFKIALLWRIRTCISLVLCGRKCLTHYPIAPSLCLNVEYSTFILVCSSTLHDRNQIGLKITEFLLCFALGTICNSPDHVLLHLKVSLNNPMGILLSCVLFRLHSLKVVFKIFQLVDFFCVCGFCFFAPSQVLFGVQHFNIPNVLKSIPTIVDRVFYSSRQQR